MRRASTPLARTLLAQAAERRPAPLLRARAAPSGSLVLLFLLALLLAAGGGGGMEKLVLILPPPSLPLPPSSSVSHCSKVKWSGLWIFRGETFCARWVTM